jgi:[ribosomal protein S5]-alanine N-acetyltransferase
MNFILETERLQLKPIPLEQLGILHSIFIDPYVREYLCDNQSFSLVQIEEMLVESQLLFAEQKFGLWFIETKQEKAVIGFVGLWYFFDESQPQLVYALLPEFTKKGYATEAATKILEYSFEELDYEYLLASCDRANLDSRKLAARIGMKEIEERIVNGSSIIFCKITKSYFL